MEELLKLTRNSEDADTQRPFQGLRSYEEKNKAQFGGRDTEIGELFNLVESSRLTIVFGKSGIGKTSLLKAGLIPELQKNYFFPIYLRIDYSSGKSPLSQVKEMIYQKLVQRDKTVSEIGSLTLWEYFVSLNLFDGQLTPVLIFDQFEEAFTIGKEKSQMVQEFILELSDLAENRVPMAVHEKRRDRLKLDTLPGNEQNFRMIISLREDYLANFESLSRYMPSMKNSRFRVLQMTVAQAMEAVLKPAKNLIDHDVAASLIKKMPGITDDDFKDSISGQDGVKRYVVEPFLLGMICFEINERRIEKGDDKISQSLVGDFDLSDVINSYYSKTRLDFGDNVIRGIEDSLLTEGGFRKLQELEEFETKYNVTDNDIQRLIEKRIIRKELRDGVEYIELTHDVLTPVIRERRDERINELKEKEKKETINRAIEQDRMKRKRIARVVLSVMATVLAALLFFVIRERIKTETYERKNRQLALANHLLISAKILSTAYGDDSTAALISMSAYLINKENGGGNDVVFYNRMYESLTNIVRFTSDSSSFEVARYADGVRTIVNADNGDVYFACRDGKIFRQKKDSVPALLTDFGPAISNIAISPDKKYLAVAGSFNDVKIINVMQEQDVHSKATGDTSGGGKSVSFTAGNRLFVRTDSTVTGWELNSWKPILWKARTQVEVWNGNKQKKVTQNVLWDKDYFKKAGIKFECMATFNDVIALGIDSGFILITNDSLAIIKSNDFGKTTAIEFDPSGQLLFTGNDQGTLFRIALSDYSAEGNQYQTTRISEIAFSNKGSYLLSSSHDKTVAVWDMDHEWNSVTPLLLSSPDESTRSAVWCVAAGIDDKYVLAGYLDGRMMKWPINVKALAGLVCYRISKGFNTSNLKKVIKQNIDFKELEKYNCNTLNK